MQGLVMTRDKKTNDPVYVPFHGNPICGIDFCDSCGDCLYCTMGDFCYGSSNGEHHWIKYTGRDRLA